jgi:hypothetical protein
VQDRVAALLRFIGSVSSMSLLTIGGYYLYNSHDKMMEKEMVTRQGYGLGIGGCNRLCRLRTVRCMDPGQVTDLLSRAHTCLWEQEGLLLSCCGFRLFSDQLIGGGDMWRSKHHIESGPQVWGLGVQVWTGTVDRSGMGWSCAWGTSEVCVFMVPSWTH